MTLRSLLAAALISTALGLASSGLTNGQTPSPSPSASAETPEPSPAASISASPKSSPSPLPVNPLAPFKERLANAASVKVMTSILGLTLGATIEQAHAKLDKLSDPAHPPKEEGGEKDKGEKEDHKVLWQLAKTDYSFVFVKVDDHERINHISGFLRSGKEIPFDKIGETKKAPVQDANTIAWDVVRPKKPLSRVVAAGANGKASNISIFVVKRPEQHEMR